MIPASPEPGADRRASCPTATSGLDRAPAPAAPPPDAARDWLLDLVRVGSVLVVVVLHWLYLRVTLVDEVLHTEIALSGPLLWVLSWLLQVMPLFFVAGGYANTLVVDRSRAGADGATRAGATRFVAERARRLLSPLLLLLVVVLAVTLAISRLDPGSAARIAERAGSHLWFLGVFLLCAALAPVAVRLHDRTGPWTVPVCLLAGSLLVDALRFGGALGPGAGTWANLALVWLFCHQLGVVHARRDLQRAAGWVTTALGTAAAALLLLLVVAGPYPVASIGLADVPEGNLLPPTSALAVLAVAQLCVLTALTRGRWRPGPRLRGLLGWLNPRLVLIYLWHVPALGAVTFLGLLAPGLLLPAGGWAWWALRPMWLVLAGAMLWVLLTAALAWEIHLRRFATRTWTVTTSLAVVLGTVGAVTAWRVGVGPTADSLLGLALVGAALLLLTSPARPESPRA
ncbi:acyltransferase family protein [Ornithinicoccus halotolerans]|uniref:acyltransferase family protein n=1 Tax=Ornithinicoccus halotolerans TaxID=1748220 RepID=UPI001296FF4E|nr:acyltransferase family protein [Ornithinicoccus halotolerans]